MGGVFPPHPTRGLESLRNYPHSSVARGPAGNAFRRILKGTERSFLHIYAGAVSSSNSILCHLGEGQGFGAMSPCLNAELHVYTTRETKLKQHNNSRPLHSMFCWTGLVVCYFHRTSFKVCLFQPVEHSFSSPLVENILISTGFYHTFMFKS